LEKDDSKRAFVGLTTVDDGDIEYALEKDDSKCAFVGARTVDDGDVMNPGQDLVDTNEDDQVSIVKITDDEDDEDVDFVINDQNINVDSQDDFYNSAMFNDDKDDNIIDSFLFHVLSQQGKCAGCKANTGRPPKPNTEGMLE
jgi:hypothetical protein